MKTTNKGPAKAPSGKQSADQVSELTTNRLSVYLRCLNVLEEASVRTISSQALADYPGFRQEGFEISALFDTLKEKVGQQSRSGVPIHDIGDLKKVAKREGIRIAVIAVPAPYAQHVLSLVVAAGIKAVLNFSPGTLQVPPDVKLKSVDLTVSLESLSFFLAQGDGEEK